MLKPRLFLEKIAHLSSPYGTEGEDVSRVVVESVKAHLFRFLKTEKGSVLVALDYGIPSIATIVEKTSDPNERPAFLVEFARILQESDRRIQSIEVQESQHFQISKEKAIPYLLIKVKLVSEFRRNKYENDPYFEIAFDTMGDAYEHKHRSVG